MDATSVIDQELSKQEPVPASTMSLDEVATLYRNLLDAVRQAEEIEAQSLIRPKDMDQSTFESALEELRNLFKITAVINGASGWSLTLGIVEASRSL